VGNTTTPSFSKIFSASFQLFCIMYYGHGVLAKIYSLIPLRKY